MIRSLTLIFRRPGAASAFALGASGVGIALDPSRAGAVMRIPPAGQRGITEMRAGLGGTFAALGAWALLRGSRDAYTAVGVTWLGAAGVRAYSLRTDKPETDSTFWAFLGLETAMGLAGIAAGDRGARRKNGRRNGRRNGRKGRTAAPAQADNG